MKTDFSFLIRQSGKTFVHCTVDVPDESKKKNPFSFSIHGTFDLWILWLLGDIATFDLCDLVVSGGHSYRRSLRSYCFRWT
jgi:hypothetical protein